MLMHSATSDATLATEHRMPAGCVLFPVRRCWGRWCHKLFHWRTLPRRLRYHCCLSFLLLPQGAGLPLDPATLPPGILRLQRVATRCEA